jgi:GWxTD domain-containing protein
MDTKLLFVPAAGLALLLAVSPSFAQSPTLTQTPAPSQTTTTPATASGSATAPSKKGAAAATGPKRDTVAKPLTAKQIKAKEDALKKELLTPYKKWMDEDVVYIISDEERKAFKQLNTDEEREQFVEQFWLRRDPTPDTEENEFKEEHYRRIAYANEHYASGIPGWRTDRGRIYIQYGPPDEIEAHSSGGSYERPISEGGGETETFPFEQWRYRYIDGVGQNIIIEFVDTTMSGEYRMTMDPSEKDALLNVPNAGLTLYEQEGLSTKTDRFNRTDGTHLGVPSQYQNQSMNEFNRMSQFFKLQEPPVVKFKDLESEITSRITYNRLPMLVRYDYLRVTETAVVVNVTLQFENHDLQFTEKDGVDKAMINIFGRVTSMTRRPVTTFEPTLEVIAPLDMLESYKNNKQVYQQSIPLPPGRYHLNVVAKDIMSGNVNVYEVALDVPHFSEDRLSSSSMILADDIEKLPTRSIGGTMFAIGDTKVRPRIGDTFKADEKMGVYVQFYNFATQERIVNPDGTVKQPASNKPDGSIEYVVSKVGSTDSLIDVTEDLSSVQYAAANQVTVQKLLPLKTLGPGVYTLKVKATDRRANQTVQQQENFIVN